MKKTRHTLIQAITVICFIAAADLGAAHDTFLLKLKPQTQLQSCRLPNVEGELRCGSLEVFENRKTGSGRKIALKIVVLPSQAAHPVGALFILAGGPGQAATDNAQFFADTFAAVRQQRDIVMVDQRGTGGSNGLQCDLTVGSGLQKYFGDLFPVEAARRCRRQLEQKADLRLYTTSSAMDDLDEVRAALGYGRIDLFGTSYGTRAALVYLRRHPDRVRSVILKGVVSMSLVLPHAIAPDAQRALDVLFADCASDKSCAQTFPNLKNEFAAVMDRFKQGSVRTRLTDSGKTEEVQISRGIFATALRSLLQNINTTNQVPLLIHRAFGGDFEPFARLILTIRRGAGEALSYGMFLSVVAAEDVPLTRSEVVRRSSRSTFLGDYYARQIMQAAAIWPRGFRPADFNLPVRWSGPVLLISGHLDPATPPQNATDTARYLSNNLNLLIRNASHSYAGLSPCVDKIMATFLERGSAKGLDTSCANEIRRAPFALK